MLLLLLISLLLFGISTALPNSEGPRQNEESHDTPSVKNMLTMMQKGEPSHHSDPYHDTNGFMRRSDGFEYEDEHHFERGLPRFIDRILAYGDTLNNRIRDSFEPQERFRRGARGYGSPGYSCSVEETCCVRHAFLCEHPYSDRRRSSRRGRRSRRRNDADHNGNENEDCRPVKLLDSSCNRTPRKQGRDENNAPKETVVENTKVAIFEDDTNNGGNPAYYNEMPTMLMGEEGELMFAEEKK